MRHLDVDLLVLVADHVDLGHVRHAQQLVAHAVDVVAQLGEGVAVGGERVDGAEGVAELVVEERTLHARRQRVADVADLLAHLVPGVGHLLGRRVVLQEHEDQRLARLGVAARVVEPGRLLQLLLQPLGDLLLDLAGGGAGPQRAHHHHLEGEVRIFGLAQAQVGIGAGQRQRDDQEQNEGLMLERPLGKIRALHSRGLRQHPHLLPGMQLVHAGTHHQIAGLEPGGDLHRVLRVAGHLHRRERGLAGLRIDDPDRRLVALLEQRGERQAGSLGSLAPSPEDTLAVMPSCTLGEGSRIVTFTV